MKPIQLTNDESAFQLVGVCHKIIVELIGDLTSWTGNNSWTGDNRVNKVGLTGGPGAVLWAICPEEEEEEVH